MKRPFILIDYIKHQCDQFTITEGFQPTYAMLYLLDGSFLLNIEDKETTLTAGDLAIFSDDVNFFRSVIDPISFIIIQFQPNPSCPFSIPVPLGKIKFKNAKRFKDSINKYQELMDIDDSRAIYYKEHLLEDILLQAFSENHSSMLLPAVSNPENTRDLIVNRAAEYIRKNLDKKVTIEDICRAAQTNPSTLNFKFRKELSSSVGGFITSERMKKARFMLSNTTHIIKEIATQCGFESVCYFSFAFHKHNGLSPTEYRKQYR